MLSCKLLFRRVPDIKVLLYRDVHRSYYDALGLTPKASQTDIKNAYYKMSMVFHPDKGANNSERFQEISTAYEILGNNKLRQLYDKGLLPSGASKYAETQEKVKSSTDNEWTAPSSSSSGQRHSAHQDWGQANFTENATHFEGRSGPHTGKTEHYDFDAWTQAHYSETFEKQKFKKAEGLKMKRTKLENFQRLEAIATGFFILIVAVTVYGQMRVHSWDDPRPRYR